MLYPGDEPTRPCGEPGNPTLSSSNSFHCHDQVGDLPWGGGPTAVEVHSGPKPECLSHRTSSRCTVQTAGRNQGVQFLVPAGPPRSALYGDLGGKTDPATRYAPTAELIHREGTNHRKEYTALRWMVLYQPYGAETTKLVIRGRGL
jgi:hypothetical protein